MTNLNRDPLLTILYLEDDSYVTDHALVEQQEDEEALTISFRIAEIYDIEVELESEIIREYGWSIAKAANYGLSRLCEDLVQEIQKKSR